MFGKKCITCNTRVGGIFGKKNWGTAKRAQCETCVDKQIHDKLHAAKKRPIRTKHAENLYAQFSDIFDDVDTSDIPYNPGDLNTECRIDDQEEWALPATNNAPQPGREESPALFANSQENTHPVNIANNSSHLQTSNGDGVDIDSRQEWVFPVAHHASQFIHEDTHAMPQNSEGETHSIVSGNDSSLLHTMDSEGIDVDNQKEWEIPVEHNVSQSAHEDAIALSLNAQNGFYPIDADSRPFIPQSANNGIINAVAFSDNADTIPEHGNLYNPVTLDIKKTDTQLIIADIIQAPVVVSVEKKHVETPETVMDIDGNVYNTVKIGNQVWTVENLKTTRLNDGAPIPLVMDNEEWARLITPGYCLFENDLNNMERLGALYNWLTIYTGKIAPHGWHVPETIEWNVMIKHLIAYEHNWDNTLVEDKIAKALAAKTGWKPSRIPGAIGNDFSKNNSSGFSALAAGCRGFEGNFYTLGEMGYWWSATEDVSFYAYYRYLSNECSNLFWDYHDMRCGFSIRLVKD